MEILVAFFVKPMVSTSIQVLTSARIDIDTLLEPFPKYSHTYQQSDSLVKIIFHWHDLNDLLLYMDNLDTLERKLLSRRDVIHVTSDHHSLGLHH